jgi:hypothetical protein
MGACGADDNAPLGETFKTLRFAMSTYTRPAITTTDGGQYAVAPLSLANFAWRSTHGKQRITLKFRIPVADTRPVGLERRFKSTGE